MRPEPGHLGSLMGHSKVSLFLISVNGDFMWEK